MIKAAQSGAAEFIDSDVAAAYVHRPDYPVALHDALVALMPQRDRVLDLGTGPGKIARALAGRVSEVIAVDPSAAMLDLGRALDGGRHANIAWTQSLAEDLQLGNATIDLAVAGAAIHWMDCARLCPKLNEALSPGAVLAIVDGDTPSQALWLDAYHGVIRGWVERLGGVWRGETHRSLATAHLDWLDLQGTNRFRTPVRQSLNGLIICEHSRATWSRARMGNLADAFDRDLRAALEPWVVDGLLEFEVEVRLDWGRPRTG
ncbi:MAG: class I SAM-dependent methyltransferase [Cypionkella sp.]